MTGPCWGKQSQGQGRYGSHDRPYKHGCPLWQRGSASLLWRMSYAIKEKIHEKKQTNHPPSTTQATPARGHSKCSDQSFPNPSKRAERQGISSGFHGTHTWFALALGPACFFVVVVVFVLFCFVCFDCRPKKKKHFCLT